MSGIMGKGSLSETPPTANALRFQTSTQGMCIPVVYGLNRVTGNLIWYGDFNQSGGGGKKGGGKGGGGGGKGKGGGGQTSYSVSFMFAICEGPILGVETVWANSSSFADPGAAGLTILDGTYPQDPWTYLLSGGSLPGLFGGLIGIPASHAGQALNYPGIAIAAEANANIGASPAMPNISYLVEGILSTGGGAWAADIIKDIVTNGKYGLNLPQWMLDLADFRDYCLALNVPLSPVYNSQKSACDQIKLLTDAMNAEIVWHDGSVFRVIPYTEEALSSTYGSWSPSITAEYDLADDDFICDATADPIKVTRSTPADAYNSAQLQYIDNSNQYNAATIQLQDQAHIDLYGRHDAGVQQFPCITDTASANQVLSLLLRRMTYIRNTYEFDLSWKYCRIEPMGVLSLTDSRLGLDQTLVRVVEVAENAEGLLTITAEDLMIVSKQLPAPFCMKKIVTSTEAAGDHNLLSRTVYMDGKLYATDNIGGVAHGRIFDGKTLALLSDVTYSSAVVGQWQNAAQMVWYPGDQGFLMVGTHSGLAYAYWLDKNLAITSKVFCGTVCWNDAHTTLYGAASSFDMERPGVGTTWLPVDLDAIYTVVDYDTIHAAGTKFSPSDGAGSIAYGNGNYYWFNLSSASYKKDAICDGAGAVKVIGPYYGGYGEVAWPMFANGNLYIWGQQWWFQAIQVNPDTLAIINQFNLPAWAFGISHWLTDPPIIVWPYAYFCVYPYSALGDPNTYVYKFDLRSFTMAGDFAVPGSDAVDPDQPFSCSMGSDGRLYVGAINSFYVLNPADMTLICRYYTEGCTEPQLQDGSLYFYGCRDISQPIIKYLPGGAVHGFQVNMNLPPGPVNTPVIFDAPGILTKTGHEVWGAVSGSDTNWGGCDVYGSTDDTSYTYLGTVWGRSIYGTLAAALPIGLDPDEVNGCNVNLNASQGALLSATQSDADKFLTLCLVESELISFATATLTGSYRYNLTYLRRGVYNSAIASHASGSRFVRLDDKILKHAYPANMVGETVWFKFCSFNTYGFAKQSLDDVTAYSFTLGTSLSYPSNVAGFAASEVSGLVVFNWTAITDSNLDGYEIRRNATGVTTWAGATVVVSGQGGNHFTGAIPAGSYTFLICAKDTSGNYSRTPGRVDLVVT